MLTIVLTALFIMFVFYNIQNSDKVRKMIYQMQYNL